MLIQMHDDNNILYRIKISNPRVKSYIKNSFIQFLTFYRREREREKKIFLYFSHVSPWTETLYLHQPFLVNFNQSSYRFFFSTLFTHYFCLYKLTHKTRVFCFPLFFFLPSLFSWKKSSFSGRWRRMMNKNKKHLMKMRHGKIKL